MLTEAGNEKKSISVVSLVDTNTLVYRFDPRFPQKQRIAAEVLRNGVLNETLCIPHQALMEFVAVVTRVHRGGQPLLSHVDATREAEELFTQFTVLYPNAVVFRTLRTLRGAAAYQLSWFDAHLWACAEHYGLDEIVSEDFEDGRFYGSCSGQKSLSDNQAIIGGCILT
jgi:predicted nucleic acid-binding protein